MERELKKDEVIRRYGEAAYNKMLKQGRKWDEAHPGNAKARGNKWRIAHPEEVEAHEYERNRKGGRRYERKLQYLQTGLQGARHKVRVKHGAGYRQYKNIIAPESQIHHEWIPGTAEYHGIALVETNRHRYGIIDVIRILAGKITLLTEEGIRAQVV